MNRMQRWVLCATAIGLAACATPALWKDRSYPERVSSVLISEDERKLVVIGERHHYVFDAPPVVVRTLKAPFHRFVEANLRSFVVAPTATSPGTTDWC